MQFQRSRRSALWTRPARAGALLAVAVGVTACLPAGWNEAEEAPVEDRAPFPLQGVVAGVAGLGVLVQNHSPYELSNVEIVINETPDGGGFRFTASHIDANTTRTYLARVFRNPDGESLNPMSEDIERFSIYADTARGPGYWRGRYGPETLR